MPAPLPALPARALGAAVLGAALALGALAGAPTSSADTAAACDSPGRAVPLDRAVAEAPGLAAVRGTSGLDGATLRRLAGDGTARLDGCGRVFVVDHAAPPSDRPLTDPSAVAVPADVLALASRPSSSRTLYLDFDGSTWSGTAWNGGAAIESPAYSIDADTTTLSALERAQVFLAWRSVAEDFAPFDVNVTTSAPAPEALTRTSPSDATYGTTVVITSTNAVGAGCGCGGKAYVGVFAGVNAQRYQPAWVFTDGSGTGGYNVGQVVSHEAGHTFGLSHDGTSSQGYYQGASGWGPIMGASYGRRASQWSRGEYADANNTEDDLAVLAGVAPLLPDDHAGTPTLLAPGTPLDGLITSRTDTDTFAFLAAGATTLEVSGPPDVSDVDVLLTVRGAGARVVATVDPTGPSATDDTLDATWTADLPATEAVYTAVVDGTSHGDPSSPGGYSDYASIGTYTVTLTTAAGPITTVPTPAPDPPPVATPTPGTPTSSPSPTPTPTPTTGTPTGTPVAFTTDRLPRARSGARYRATIRFTGPVLEAKVWLTLPRGLRWRARSDRLVVSGRLHGHGTRHLTAELLASDGTTVRRTFRIVVR
ncbi:M12 family metallo-peptidase [Nocardioides zeicaulis]|uniref:M12 family metallo-peptidase n=1 Tax=Nocardioides zeicaulis TaxID=1776857 RepID=A0ABV6E496_9ACTN